MEKQDIFFFSLLITFWALNYPLIKLALNYMHPFYLTFFRLLFTLPFLAILIPHGFKPLKGIKKNLEVLIFGALGVLGTWTLWYLGENYISSSLAAIIMYTYPIITIVLAAAFIREKLGLVRLTGALLGFIGIVFILYEQIFVTNPIGILLVFLSSISWSISIIFYKRTLSGENYATVNTYQMIYALPLSAILLLFNSPPSHLPLSFWMIILLLSFPGTAVTFTIYVYMYSKYSVNRITAYLFLVPAISVLFSYVIFRTEFTPLEIMGFALVICGIYMASR